MTEQEIMEIVKAKREPIRDCEHMSKRLIGSRGGYVYLSERFRFDFERRMHELADFKAAQKGCYMSQQDDEYSNWYICSNCHEDFYWGEEPDDMRRSNISYCPFCGAKIGDVIFMENSFDEEE